MQGLIFFLSDEELSDGPQPPTPPPRRTSTHSWGLGCIGRQDAQSRSFSNIADGLRLAHAQALAVAGIVHQSSTGSAPFRRGLRASFHGRGTPRTLYPRGHHLSCPTTPASARKEHHPRPPRGGLLALPAPPSQAAQSSTGREDPSGQLLSVRALLQHMASLRPCVTLPYVSSRVLPRTPPRQPHMPFHRRSLRAPPRKPHITFHRSLDNFHPSSSDSDSELETNHTLASFHLEDQSEVSSSVSEVVASTHSLPQCGSVHHAPHHTTSYNHNFHSQYHQHQPHRHLPQVPQSEANHHHHRHYQQIYQYHRLLPEESDHNHHHDSHQQQAQQLPPHQHQVPQTSPQASHNHHQNLHLHHHHHLHHCVLPSSVSTLKLSSPSAGVFAGALDWDRPLTVRVMEAFQGTAILRVSQAALEVCPDLTLRLSALLRVWSV
ncbi:putative Muscle calcium channel subunit alpha-1-like 2, partial [Homarus americanus]